MISSFYVCYFCCKYHSWNNWENECEYSNIEKLKEIAKTYLKNKELVLEQKNE